MWWIIIALLVVLPIGFLLFTPLIVIVESERCILEIRLTGIAKGNLLFDGKFKMSLWVLGFKYQAVLGASRKRNQEGQKKKSRGRRLKLPGMIRKSEALLRSFRIKKFYLDVDTGNFMLNSWLYPAFHFADPQHRCWNVNFNGKTSISFQAENNLLRLLRALLS